MPQTADRRESRRRCSPPLTILSLRRRPIVRRAAAAALSPPGALAVSSCEPQAAPNAALHAEEPHSTLQRAADRRPAREASAALIGPDRVHSQGAHSSCIARHSAVPRPPDALATCSCELEAVPDAPLRAGEPHTAPQPAECREGRRQRLTTSDRAYPQEAACRASRGRGGSKAATYPSHRLLRVRGCDRRCPPYRRASQRAAARCRAQTDALRRQLPVAVHHLITMLSPQRSPVTRRGAGTVLRPQDALITCSSELQAVPDAAPRAREPHTAPQHSAARRLPPEPLAASHRPPRGLPSRGVLSRTARQGRS